MLALLMIGTPAFGQTPPVPPVPDLWVPRAGVELIALDKITARATTLQGRVGQTLRFGTLSIAVRACLVTGPDRPVDQTAYLDITDSRDAALSFHGWMLTSAPAVSMLAHPVYDIRLAGCRA